MPAKGEDTSLLSSLISFFGVSGKESPVRNFILRQIRPFVDEVTVDRMGNLVAHKKGRGPRVMLAAHMDEIGLMVKRVEASGFIYCTAIGGIDPAAFVGSQVHIQTNPSPRLGYKHPRRVPQGPLHGFVTTKEMSAGKYISSLPTIEDIFIDTGLKRDELRKMGVETGSYVFLEEHTCCSGKEGMVLGKALDNRIGCHILIGLARRLKKSRADIYFVFTVQEEIGLYGAKTSAFTIEPDWGIVVDTTHANDAYPEPSRLIGNGPCLVVKDGEFISNPCLIDYIKALGRRKKIPFQLEATESGTTDAVTIQTSRGGVPTVAITIPVRNIHTTAGIASTKDIENCILLLSEALKSPPTRCIS